jgi:acetyl esterase
LPETDRHPPDYKSLIDEATWDFIRRSDAAWPTGIAAGDVAGQRAAYAVLCAAFRAPRPEGVAVEDRSIAGVPCRVYTAGASTVTLVYCHGGGFVLGGLESHDDVCAELCAGAGVRVVSVDYRLAPEHRHPAQYDDALAVARSLPGPLVLAGDSAGGALMASVAHALRGTADLRGMILVYPSLGGDPARGSHVVHAEAPMLTRTDMEHYAELRHGGPPPARDVTAAALHDSDFSALPPTAIFSAECDPLADDGGAYAEAIRRAGGSADWYLEKGLVHGYLRARHSVPRAQESFARIVSTLKRFAS